MEDGNNLMEELVNLCKNRGFVFASSEIYGGLSNTWDYGPLGVELKNNVKKMWWKKFVQESSLNVGLDSAILMNPEVWVASGHVGSFTDPLADCRECKTRHRADKLAQDQTGVNVDGLSNEELDCFLQEHKIACPECGKSNFTPIKKFNLMFKTHQGVTQGSANEIFLRPETAQGIFVNFANLQRATRKKLPFGVAQIGKAFRNEITPGNFIFRTREFEQMELEFFCKPGEDLKWFEYWKKYCYEWLLGLGISKEKTRFRDHKGKELSHYSKGTSDIEFLFPFGWGELWGIANRTNYDLKKHMENSGKSLEYYDQESNEHYLPYVIEPSLGADRVTLAFLCDAFTKEELAEGESRTILKLHPALAPVKACVLPLSKKLNEGAKKVLDMLACSFSVDFDDSGSIGKRYRRQDEIGTPFCVTYDFDSESDGKVTVRDRDSMKQERIAIDKLNDYVLDKIRF